jgi:hypothetical protein
MGAIPRQCHEGSKMRAVALAFLLFGTLFFLFPLYDDWVRWIRISSDDSRLIGGLMVACGALALAIQHRRT